MNILEGLFKGGSIANLFLVLFILFARKFQISKTGFMTSFFVLVSINKEKFI